MVRDAVAGRGPADGLRGDGAGPWLLAGPWLCMLAGVVASKLAPALLLPLSLCFWALIVMAVAREVGRLRELVWFVPLGVLYFLTFVGLRERVRAPDFVLGSDTWWHLQGGQLLFVQFRHLGYGIVSFASRPVRALGEALSGSSAWGDHYLFAESALAGALAAACLHAVVSRRLARREALLFAHLFAFSFSIWALAAVVDTFILSLLLFLLFLSSLLRDRGPTGSAAAAGMLTAVALLTSLENVYFAAVYFCVFLVDGVAGREWRWRQLATYLSVAALVFVATERVALMVHGPKIYRTALDLRHVETARSAAESIERYARGWADPGALRSPTALLRTLGEVAGPGVIARRERRISAYAAADGGAWGAIEVAYLALAIPLAVVCLVSFAGRALRGEALALTAALMGALVARTLFMTVWARADAALFSPPSIAVLWIAIAAGAAPLVRGGRVGRRRLFDLWLLLLALLLLVSNAGYLLSV